MRIFAHGIWGLIIHWSFRWGTPFSGALFKHRWMETMENRPKPNQTCPQHMFLPAFICVRAKCGPQQITPPHRAHFILNSATFVGHLVCLECCKNIVLSFERIFSTSKMCVHNTHIHYNIWVAQRKYNKLFAYVVCILWVCHLVLMLRELICSCGDLQNVIKIQRPHNTFAWLVTICEHRIQRSSS